MTAREMYLRKLAEREGYDLEPLGAAWTATHPTRPPLRWESTVMTTEEAIQAIESIRDNLAGVRATTAEFLARLDERDAWLR